MMEMCHVLYILIPEHYSTSENVNFAKNVILLSSVVCSVYFNNLSMFILQKIPYLNYSNTNFTVYACRLRSQGYMKGLHMQHIV